MVKPMTPAQKQLAEDHMDLVPKIIRSLTNGSPLPSEQRQELCQIGYLALCRAAVSCGEGFPFTPDRKSTRLNSSHGAKSRMPSSA